VKLLLCLEVLAVEVGDDVRMPEARETLKLGVELLALLLGHFAIVDFFPAEYKAVDLSLHLANDSKRSMT
jgi:hypothetical protein